MSVNKHKRSRGNKQFLVFIFDILEGMNSDKSVSLFENCPSERCASFELVGPRSSRLCVRAAGAGGPSCGVRARSWNHPNPLLQPQHLLVRRNQLEVRVRSRDKSAYSVILSGNPGGGVYNKSQPPTTQNSPRWHPPSLSTPPPSGFDILDPCVEEYPPFFTILPWIKKEKWQGISCPVRIYQTSLWKRVCVYSSLTFHGINWDIPILEFEVLACCHLQAFRSQSACFITHLLSRHSRLELR